MGKFMPVAFERLVMRLRKAGTYELREVGDYYVVYHNGYVSDSVVNLYSPHIEGSTEGNPYMNQYLGTKEQAERILKRLQGLKAYAA